MTDPRSYAPPSIVLAKIVIAHEVSWRAGFQSEIKFLALPSHPSEGIPLYLDRQQISRISI